MSLPNTQTKTVAPAIPDAKARADAIDPTRSFIVQAPAGSGKTGLLVARILKLLAIVDHPGEILAITFTFKAASEMRERVLGVLKSAASDEPPQDAWEQTLYHLARKVLARDVEKNWQILTSPCFSIQTIDAFCAKLIQRAPLEAGVDANAKITDEPMLAFRAVVESVWQDIARLPEPLQEALQTLLKNFDHKYDYVTSLLTGLLACREQWLPFFATAQSLQVSDWVTLLEQHFKAHVEHALSAAVQEIDHQKIDELSELLARQMTLLMNQDPDHTLLQHPFFEQASLSHQLSAGFLSKLTGDLDALENWQLICQQFLTSAGKKRSRFERKLGFLPKSEKGLEAEAKAERIDLQTSAVAWLESLSDADIAVLNSIMRLPSGEYSLSAKTTLQALTLILPHLAASLKLHWQATTTVDFTEIALGALTLTRNISDESEAISDSLLWLDHRIQHILIDEYQDTATLQHQLLEQLTAGFEPGDGRTVFLVGDPMQSIYRFREADVSLFLRLQQTGLPTVDIEPLHLVANFRSDDTIIHWVNETFADLFPTRSDTTRGAVEYHAAQSMKQGEDGVHWHLLADQTVEQEADYLLACIQAANVENPDQSKAVIIRRRADAAALIPKLQAAEIPFLAQDLFILQNVPIVQIMMTVTAAINDFYDRIHWFAWLKSPFVGLSHQEMMTVAPDERETVITQIWQYLADDHNAANPVYERLLPLKSIFERLKMQRAKMPVADLIKSTWEMLSGYTLATAGYELKIIAQFWPLLFKHASAASIDMKGLERALKTTYTDVGSPNAKLEIITMHKAKGLEYDMVIVPGLASMISQADPKMLYWQADEAGLLLAPHESSQMTDKRLNYQWLGDLEREKNAYERVRLLYVTATRAKKTLHLVGRADTLLEEGECANKSLTKADLKPLHSVSLLSQMWSSIPEEAGRHCHIVPPNTSTNSPSNDETETAAPFWLDKVLTPDPKQLTALTTFYPASKPLIASQNPLAEAEEKTLANESTDALQELQLFERQFGIAVHALLAWAAYQNDWQDKIACRWNGFWALLRREGMPLNQLERARTQFETLIKHLQKDEKAAWILSRHEAHGVEIALDHVEDLCEKKRSDSAPLQIRQSIIDRQFVDEQGVHWIVDYKTTTLNKNQTPEALNQALQEKYAEQLTRYRQIWSALHPDCTIKTAIYCPMVPLWVEVF